jgi:hypothetical protein
MYGLDVPMTYVLVPNVASVGLRAGNCLGGNRP